MIPAFENWPLSEDYPAIDKNQSHIWNIFIQRILKVGYILPGTISDLGREFNSWIVKWPEDGFKDTSVFNNLQFTGSSCKMINDIPPIEFHPKSALDELTVILTSGAKYTIRSSDLTKITCLTPGIYTIQEAKDGGRNHDLVVTEIHLNFEIYEAIRKINELVRQVNGITAQVRKKWTDKIRRKTNDLTFLNECKGSGRLTKAIAMLSLDTLPWPTRLMAER